MRFCALRERRVLHVSAMSSFKRGRRCRGQSKRLFPVIGLIAASTQAQLLPTWETSITLTQQDIDMINGAVDNQIHGKPLGTTASWSNPASGNSGFIKLGKKLTRKNQQCEEIEYTVRSGRPPGYTEHYHFTSWLQPDGTWKNRVSLIVRDGSQLVANALRPMPLLAICLIILGCSC